MMSEDAARTPAGVPTAGSSEPGKVYQPTEVEGRIYARWRREGWFSPDGRPDAPPYSIVLPPPNVTGRLHMGHALTATIQDLLVRWHRMRGFSALWVPGTDHAGIATQVMVERALESEGSSRLGLGREAFVARTWQWKEQYGGTIDQQHERLGASLDWDRYRFTMDPVSSRAVTECFVRLFEDGLVYRAYRLINWDWGTQTAVSDLEVEHRTTQGSLWKIAYPVEGRDEVLVVATTRPETMLGDSGVAVHPDDPRYRHLIGSHVVLPLTGRKIPVVGDAILVDMEFGTGAVKVTPAHDFNDFETGQRHNLAVLQVIDAAGTICAPAPQAFVGMTVGEARKAVVAALEAEGRLVGTEPHTLSVGYSQRSGKVIEPLPSTQWYVRVAPLADKALAAVRSGETTIVPAHRTQDYYRWMENLRDWCVSRQLWWGHRIPAWHCGACKEITVARTAPAQCRACGSVDLAQDEDVLDTWFSSGLWPLTCLGWPDADAKDLARFYPTSLMETGWDILFFWVARMMMFGCHFTGKAPFSTVFLHSMVLGEDGQKMSKMKGNVVDPLELSDAYGADALRFYLATMAGQDLGIVFSRARVEGYRNFCNKLWNAARFGAMNLRDFDADGFQRDVIDAGAWDGFSAADRWILARLVEVASEVDGHLRSYRIDWAAHALYQFVWGDLCDWYIELIKPDLRESAEPGRRFVARGTLALVLEHSLRLLHPFIPFVTEALWSTLPRAHPRTLDEGALIGARYATPMGGTNAVPGEHRSPLDPLAALIAQSTTLAASADIKRLIGLVTTARMLKAECRVPPAQRVDVLVRAADDEENASLGRITDLAAIAGRLGQVRVLARDESPPRESIAAVHGTMEVVLPIAGLVDIGEERARIQKELDKSRAALKALQGKLQNEGFVARAPAHVVEGERARLHDLTTAVGRLEAIAARLGSA